MMGSRITHLRELNFELDRQRAANAVLREDIALLQSHFDMALLAAMDLRDLPEGGTFEIWDGWNLILGANKVAKDRADLLAQAKARITASQPGTLKIWIVLDGNDEKVANPVDGVRVSYTGGKGEHRADKFICDYLRMANYLGLSKKVTVRTDDKDFLKTVHRLQSA